MAKSGGLYRREGNSTKLVKRTTIKRVKTRVNKRPAQPPAKSETNAAADKGEASPSKAAANKSIGEEKK